ncbi:SKI3 subunit of superkiller complex protein [Microplitis mediator]|uniref:SKI3 subunit of superkiller complex protein n=1 Tax=Microplitis mediator TaxID=375433 RepID=UPI002554E42E|nr:SKI3 subunit of superkiller complex protein [Microplitis mediator]
MSKDIKVALKEIRSCLDDHQYVEAMKKCQKLLKMDKKNYMGLILLGAAMKDIDEYKSQAPLAYRKAIDVQPDNPLAWRGLVKFYEGQPGNVETWRELVPAYCKLLKFESDPQKIINYLDQLSRLSIILNDNKIFDEVINVILELKEDKDKNELYKLDHTLLSLFNGFSKALPKYYELYKTILISSIQKDTPPKYMEYYKNYLKLLFSEKNYLGLFSAATQINLKYPRELYPLEWICRVYAEQVVLENYDTIEDIAIDLYYQSLLDLDSNSYLAIFAKAMHYYQNNNYVESRDLLYQVVTLHQKYLFPWVALTKINAKLHCWQETENAAENAFNLNVKSRRELITKVNLLQIESLIRSDSKKKWEQAAGKCKKLLENDSSKKLKLLLTRAQLLQEIPEALNLLEELENDPETHQEAAVVRGLYLKNRGSYEEAIDVLGAVLDTSEAWQILGTIYWKMSNYSHSLMAFLKGIHADPNDWECLVYLGHYYREHGNDLEKSRKCYQKALRINPNSEEAGAGLSTAYRLLKNTEANMQMLQRVTTVEGGGPKWAWLQLGLQQLDQGKIEQAIKSLRYVIRADPNDNHCWESLADAYWARGAHTSALKSYQRALELSPGSLYPMIQLANIKLVLGRHDEAKEAFTQVLSQEQRYIPALKGLAETCLGLAKENASKQLLGRARRNCQQAIDSLTDAIIENSNLSCLWKLLGDACYRVAILPEKYCYVEVTPGLIKSMSEKYRIEIHQSELFTLAARSYCRALSITKDSSLLWHDLACCYLAQVHHDSTVNRKITAEKSLEAAKQAVRLCSTTWVHWNILGVICMLPEIKNYALAQHSWVMAIDREPNNGVAWTNLGTLYLYLGETIKANRAFSRSQRADPEYSNSWIGQGIIAESIDNKEAMDLFRHAIQLGYHPQAAVGYSHWVLMTILNPEARKDPLYHYMIVNMHAIPVAIDAMTWYTEREPDVIYGRNALGLLLERQKLFKLAAHEYSVALKLGKDDSQEDHIRVNLARVLVQMGQFNEAIDICQHIKTASFSSHCQLALALFKAARYEESYAAYEAALNWLADDGSDKAHVLCAMASMAYMFQEVDDAKTLLFQCIEIQPPTVSGLLAAAALGLLHDDLNLTSLVLKELEIYKDDPKYRHHVARLSAYSCLMHEDITGAIRIISKSIHRRPDDVGSWISLVRILLETNSSDFGYCAQKALHLGRKNSSVSVAKIACVSSLGQLIDYNNDQSKCGLRSVQKTIYSFPGNVESWTNLIVAALPRCTTNDSAPNLKWLSSLISIIRDQWKCSKPMDDWLQINQEKINELSAKC